jgi:hypothetical protein
MPTSTISYLWRDRNAAQSFSTGVSLHSHTNQSQETLDFVADWGSQYKLIKPLLERLERRSHNNHSIPIDWARSYWTPPLTPKLAFDLESRQIENLDCASLVSISDHDNIQAPLLLRSVPSTRHIPISVEWTAPYAGAHNSKQYFHLGIHNLPSARAAEWMTTLAEFTVKPSDARLTELLIALNAEPNVLVIFNHPLWDLYRIGQEKHEFLVNEFLQINGAHFHALELNGLRDWEENRAVRQLAERWNMLLISGGDRHGVEPNANVNLTNATSFNEFVHEVRKERRSNVLFMPQYAEPWKHRILQSTMDAIRNYPEFPQGSQTWDQRVYHPDANGVVRPLSEIWPSGRPPRVLSSMLYMIRLMGKGPFSSSLRYAWSDSSKLRFELGDQEAY